MTCPLCAEYTLAAQDPEILWSLTLADFWEMRAHLLICPEFQAKIAAALAQLPAVPVVIPERWPVQEVEMNA